MPPAIKHTAVVNFMGIRPDRVSLKNPISKIQPIAVKRPAIAVKNAKALISFNLATNFYTLNGTVKKKVAPLFSSDSAQIFPPCASIMFFVI